MKIRLPKLHLSRRIVAASACLALMLCGSSAAFIFQRMNTNAEPANQAAQSVKSDQPQPQPDARQDPVDKTAASATESTLPATPVAKSSSTPKPAKTYVTPVPPPAGPVTSITLSPSGTSLSYRTDGKSNMDYKVFIDPAPSYANTTNAMLSKNSSSDVDSGFVYFLFDTFHGYAGEWKLFVCQISGQDCVVTSPSIYLKVTGTTAEGYACGPSAANPGCTPSYSWHY